jgi:hypothetical protein
MFMKTWCTISCGIVLMMPVSMAWLPTNWVTILVLRRSICVASRLLMPMIPSMLLVVVIWLQCMLGNSGKPVALETSSCMKFVKWVFMNLEPVKIWNLETAKLRRCKLAKIWNLKLAKLRSRKLAKIWNLEPAKLWCCEPVKTWSREPAKPRNRKCEIRESSGGQVRMSRRMKVSGFDVWTSGRLVNVWDVKDIHVRVHTRNILWVRGVFLKCKSPFVSL